MPEAYQWPILIILVVYNTHQLNLDIIIYINKVNCLISVDQYCNSVRLSGPVAAGEIFEGMLPHTEEVKLPNKTRAWQVSYSVD